jgi:hypothetical protein
MRLIDSIEAESEFRARPGPLCRWCDYANICPSAPEVARSAAPERTEVSTALVPDASEDGRQLSLLGD